MDPPASPLPMLDWEGCFNVRDVGGLATNDGRTTRSGVLVRADSLCRLSDEGCRAAREYGVASVVDLRSVGEVNESGPLIRRMSSGPVLEQVGTHPFLPTGSHGEGVLYRRQGLWDDSNDTFLTRINSATSQMHIYQIILDAGAPRFASVARVVAESSTGATIVHCHIGKDRTGLVIALILAAVGVTDEAIAADYALSAQGLQSLRDFRRTLDPPPESEPHDRSYASPSGAMLTLLEQLRGTHGGAAGYLRSGGLTDSEMLMLRTRLVEKRGPSPVTAIGIARRWAGKRPHSYQIRNRDH